METITETMVKELNSLLNIIGVTIKAKYVIPTIKIHSTDCIIEFIESKNELETKVDSLSEDFFNIVKRFFKTKNIEIYTNKNRTIVWSQNSSVYDPTIIPYFVCAVSDTDMNNKTLTYDTLYTGEDEILKVSLAYMASYPTNFITSLNLKQVPALFVNDGEVAFGNINLIENSFAIKCFIPPSVNKKFIFDVLNISNKDVIVEAMNNNQTLVAAQKSSKNIEHILRYNNFIYCV